MSLEDDITDLYKQAEESEDSDGDSWSSDDAARAGELHKALVDSWEMDPQRARLVAMGAVRDMPDYDPSGWNPGTMALNALKGGLGMGVGSGLAGLAWSGGDKKDALLSGLVGGTIGAGVGGLAPELSRTLQGPAPGEFRSKATLAASIPGSIPGVVGAAGPAMRRAKIRDRIRQALNA